MPRDEEVQYEQDRRGNEKKKLDEIRGREGNVGDFGDNNGMVEVLSAQTGSARTAYVLPDHASRAHIVDITAKNSAASGGDFHLISGEPDGSGGMSDTTRRSVDINVATGNTRIEDYTGEAVTDEAIGVVSEFQGQFGLGILSDHDEAEEPATENTQTP